LWLCTAESSDSQHNPRLRIGAGHSIVTKRRTAKAAGPNTRSNALFDGPGIEKTQTETLRGGLVGLLLQGGVSRRPRLEELFLAKEQRVYIVGGELNAVAVSNGVRGAGLDAVATKDAARIVDIVGLRVTLAGRDALRFGVFRRFNVNAIRGARRRAQIAGDALLEAVLVALQDVDTAIARLHARRDFRKILGGSFAEHGPQSDAKAFEERHERLAHFSNDRCHRESL